MGKGRPTKCTPETVGKLTQAIQLGATYELACNYAGIDYSTFARWMNEKRDFREAIKEAEGKASVVWLAKIEQAASEGNWQAAAWKLERRYPEQYGRRVQDVRARIDVRELTDEELEAIAKGQSRNE
jgi:hypothetical protein